MNGMGSTAPRALPSPSRCTSKCRCAPEALPDAPDRPITWPAVTCSPTVTNGRTIWWQYRVMTLLACRMSTYQPQPKTARLPSRSQLYGAPLRLASQVATSTIPAAAAWIGVPLGTPMSTPLWFGRSAVRKPDVIGPTTGTVQPEAAIDMPDEHCSSRLLPTARLAPPVNASTISD